MCFYLAGTAAEAGGHRERWKHAREIEYLPSMHVITSWLSSSGKGKMKRMIGSCSIIPILPVFECGVNMWRVDITHAWVIVEICLGCKKQYSSRRTYTEHTQPWHWSNIDPTGSHPDYVRQSQLFEKQCTDACVAADMRHRIQAQNYERMYDMELDAAQRHREVQ